MEKLEKEESTERLEKCWWLDQEHSMSLQILVTPMRLFVNRRKWSKAGMSNGGPLSIF